MARTCLNPPESGLKRIGCPEPAAFCSANVPRREGPAVGSVSNDADRTRNIDALDVRRDLFDGVFHDTSPSEPSFLVLPQYPRRRGAASCTKRMPVSARLNMSWLEVENAEVRRAPSTTVVR
jgi:hypothetical protein